MQCHFRTLVPLLWAFCCAMGVAAGMAEGGFAVDTEIERQNNQSLLWGPYKPNLYFGVRPRLPKSLWAGLMWVRVSDFEGFQNSFRYTCEQHGDIHGYGWDEYDVRRGGVQTIHDEGNGIDLTTSFVKIPGGSHGGSWAARIKGVPRDDAPADLKTTLMFYLAQEGLGDLAVNTDGGAERGFDGDVTFTGHSAHLGDYTIVVTKGTGEHPTSDEPLARERSADKTIVWSSMVPAEMLWQGRPIAFKQLKESINAISDFIDPEAPPPPWLVYQLPNKPGSGNAHLIQKIFEGAFEFDVIFKSASAEKDIASEDITEEIQSTLQSFNDRFSRVFDLKSPFDGQQYQKFAKSMLSNLLGGIGFFHGEQIVDRSDAPEYEEENEGFWEDAAEARSRRQEKLEGPYDLFTSVPSRPFFPRGFLWDEGFHLIPVAEWDLDLTLEIVKSWFNLMDDDGWIAREQILGPEPRSKVPEEFTIQYPHYANPPTLFLIVHDFVTRLRDAKDGRTSKLDTSDSPLRASHIQDANVGEAYVRTIYPLLRRHYEWFRKTQRGDIRSYDREAFSTREGYRWKGRTETHVLTSGLDDYPRAQPPHPGELHVDLMSWVGFMAKSLLSISEALGMKEDAEEYQETLTAITRNLDDLHWSEKEGCYCDATIDSFEEHTLVCHKGYISLFPFLLGLLPHDSPKVGKLLELIGSKEHLFSDHGLRSLSMQDEFYGSAENYWRSPVWVNINYLALVQLQNVAKQAGPNQEQARDIYNKLRRNLVDTIFKSWQETGFAWEQYNPETGSGQRTQHFTGWTSLVVKIMEMSEIEVGARERDEL